MAGGRSVKSTPGPPSSSTIHVAGNAAPAKTKQSNQQDERSGHGTREIGTRKDLRIARGLIFLPPEIMVLLPANAQRTMIHLGVAQMMMKCRNEDTIIPTSIQARIHSLM
jgi:hypothetical protein